MDYIAHEQRMELMTHQANFFANVKRKIYSHLPGTIFRNNTYVISRYV